ncbi:translation initiation factor IF-2-like isoform X2 [Moschus berezovskii]|nr:translation initiation factor IF-2-like isoform X2 [Moschus berezovskii]
MAACKVGDSDWTPGSGGSRGEGNGFPTPVSLPGKAPWHRSLAGYSPWGRRVPPGSLEARSPRSRRQQLLAVDPDPPTCTNILRPFPPRLPGARPGLNKHSGPVLPASALGKAQPGAAEGPTGLPLQSRPRQSLPVCRYQRLGARPGARQKWTDNS